MGIDGGKSYAKSVSSAVRRPDRGDQCNGGRSCLLRHVLSGKVDHIYGAVNGIEGVLAEKFLDLGKKLDSAEKISLLMQTPAAALGSCRYKTGGPGREHRRILKRFSGFFADMRSVILSISAEMIRWIP